MSIFDFLKGSSEKALATDIIRLHKENSGSFDAVIKRLEAQVSTLERQNKDKRKGDSFVAFYAMGEGTSLGDNYAHCGGQILYFSAAPSFAEASDIIPYTAGKIANFLREASIPEPYISGQNDTFFAKVGLAAKYTANEIKNARANLAHGYLTGLLKDVNLSVEKVNGQFLRLVQTDPAWLESTRGWQAANNMVTLEGAGRSPMAILQNRLTHAAPVGVASVLGTYFAPVTESALGEISSVLLEGSDPDALDELMPLVQKDVDEFLVKVGNEWRTW